MARQNDSGLRCRPIKVKRVRGERKNAGEGYPTGNCLHVGQDCILCETGDKPVPRRLLIHPF